jgi:hypothetical protein
MKLFLASLGVGIVVPGFLLLGLLFLKVLFPEASEGTSIIVLNLYCWPIAVIRYIPGMRVEVMLLISFFLGTVINVTLLTTVTYFFFRSILAKRAHARSAAPPPPPSFDHSL